MYHIALFRLKNRFMSKSLFYSVVNILKAMHLALTMWNTIAHAEQNRSQSNWSKLLVQVTQEDARACTASTNISSVLNGRESITLLLRLFEDSYLILHACSFISNPKRFCSSFFV